MTQLHPPTIQPDRPMMRPHRGGTVLTLGILSLVLMFVCGGWILGLIAWLMGNGDLQAMARGEMDPSGRSNTQAGRICGIISVALSALSVLVYLAAVLLFGAAIFSIGASGQMPGR